ncbi:hypothetical protein C8Q80DRAFT_1121047 [Daedaleopsis nitida]|nr:hypothetical protein C8Q80DRAFT_1121047 [Daedaleopsis nitida]
MAGHHDACCHSPDAVFTLAQLGNALLMLSYQSNIENPEREVRICLRCLESALGTEGSDCVHGFWDRPGHADNVQATWDYGDAEPPSPPSDELWEQVSPGTTWFVDNLDCLPCLPQADAASSSPPLEPESEQMEGKGKGRAPSSSKMPSSWGASREHAPLRYGTVAAESSSTPARRGYRETYTPPVTSLTAREVGNPYVSAGTSSTTPRVRRSTVTQQPYTATEQRTPASPTTQRAPGASQRAPVASQRTYTQRAPTATTQQPVISAVPAVPVPAPAAPAAPAVGVGGAIIPDPQRIPANRLVLVDPQVPHPGKYYVVTYGRHIGIFRTYADAHASVDRVPGASWVSHRNYNEALASWNSSANGTGIGYWPY